MHVLYITDYFNTPEEGGLLRTWETSRFLKKKGYKVTVICSSAHHMTGRSSSKNRLFDKKTISGIEVIKTFSYPNYRKSIINRKLHYVLFPVLAFLFALKVKQPDIIIASSPPLSLLPLGFLLCKFKRIKFIIEIRDAWLEFAIKRKLVPRTLVAPLKALQNFLLRRADNIISVTPGIKRLVDSYTADASKNVLVMNGFEDGIKDMAKYSKEDIDEISKKHAIKGKFVVIYAGTLGLARDHEIFGKTALLLKDYKDIIFLFIGDGERKKELVDYCQSNKLKNCKFLSLQPRHKIPLFLKASHVAINSIRKNDALESSLSNKIFDYLGNGVPVVFSGDGDTTDFLDKSKGGIVIEPENSEEMKKAILKLYNSEKLRKEMGRLGRKYVLENYPRSKMLPKLEEVL